VVKRRRAILGIVMREVLEQATDLTQDAGLKIKHIVVDLGFRGVNADNPDKEIIHRGKFKHCKTAMFQQSFCWS